MILLFANLSGSTINEQNQRKETLNVVMGLCYMGQTTN